MDVQDFLKSRFSVNFGMILGRIVPVNFGYYLSGIIGKYLAKQKSSPMVNAVRQNQWVVRGRNASPSELDQAVCSVFAHAGRCFIDLYHNFDSQVRTETLVKESAETKQIINLINNPSFGALVVAPHLSNFDFALLGLAVRGLSGQVLSFGTPTGGYKIQNRLRTKTGLDITPINQFSIKKAINYMRNGGFVFTGVDRPVENKDKTLNFFGYPSPLPVGHIRMAIIADVPIIVASASMDSDGYYHIEFSNPIQMQSFKNSEDEIRVNAELILGIFEERIRRHPGQWLMYYPVWPSLSEI